MPIISIIIPVFKVEEYIEECIQSVLSQTLAEKELLECILVDDCGGDSSIDIARKIIAEYDGPIKFKIVRREKNGGLSAARNSGIKQARGKYVYFLDSDDILPEDAMESLWERAKQYPGVDIVTGEFLPFPDTGYRAEFHGKNPPEFMEGVELQANYFELMPEIACNKLVRREWLETKDLYFMEGILHEDHHWYVRMYEYLGSLAIVEKVTYLYRQREGSITQNINVLERRRLNFIKIYSDLLAKSGLCDNNWGHFVFGRLYFVRQRSLKEGKAEFGRVAKIFRKAIWQNKRLSFFKKVAIAYLFTNHCHIGIANRLMRL